MHTRSYRTAIAVGCGIALTLALVGCNERAPAETAGRQIDKAIDRTADKIDELAGSASAELKKEVAQASEVINDTTVTAKVKAALLNEPQLKTLQIEVETLGGVVILTVCGHAAKSEREAGRKHNHRCKSVTIVYKCKDHINR